MNAPPGPDKSEKKWQFVRHIRASDVDPADPPALYRDFVSFLEEHCSSPAHYVRYCQTFLGMVPFLDEVPGRRVLETGSFSFISRFLGEQGFKFRKSHSDLRYSIDAEDFSVDLLLSLEVVEHLKDQTEKAMNEIVLFQGSGIATYAREAARVLAPGGLLVLTTPNPCSARALELLVTNRPPMIFRPHAREYTRTELTEIFAPFEVVAYRTFYSFFHLEKSAQRQWEAVFERNGWDARDRGDDHFLVFRKPAG